MKTIISISAGGPRKETVASLERKIGNVKKQMFKYKQQLDALKAKLAKVKATEISKKPAVKRPATKKTAVKGAVSKPGQAKWLRKRNAK